MAENEDKETRGPGEKATPAVTAKAAPHKPHRSAGALLKLIVVRSYAMVILLVVAWACYMAVSYLIVSVFYPQHVPPRFLQWQGSLDANSLRTGNVAGVTDPAARAPIAHYHKVDGWFQPEAHNGCTVEGCHLPLPHTRQATVGPFANLHSTFMSCRMCHAKEQHASLKATWFTSATATPQDPPAILRLIKYLETSAEQIKSDPPAAHLAIIDLLRATVKASPSDAILEDLLVQIESSTPDTPYWAGAIKKLTIELPLHARGEYGAKLSLTQGGAWPAEVDLVRRARDFRSAGGPQRQEISDSIHAGVLTKPEACVSCHRQDAGMDFEAAGYSPKRAAFLRGLALAKMIERIRQGERIQLPEFLGTKEAAPK